MAKTRGRPKGDRTDAPVKLDKALVGMAKAIATARGISPAEYLSGITNAPINRDYAKMLREADQKGESNQQ